MKTRHLVSLAAFAFVNSACDRKSASAPAADPALASQVAALELKNAAAVARQMELEQELENQKLAAERDAIERERLLIEEARRELEQKQSESANNEALALLQREKDLAAREGKVELIQSNLEEQQAKLTQRETELSDRDQQLAGREAIEFQDTHHAPADAAPVGDYGMFYDQLSSYGAWLDSPEYGYVWQPVIVKDRSWRPYTRGRWACSDQGWTWISDEPFGWATYHYGRWALCKNRGWIWVPGTQWAPSWVSWRSNGSHVGWAPLPPETLVYHENRWDQTVDTTFGIGASWFVFVETRHFGNPIHHHCLPYERNPVFIQETTNITHIHVHNRRIICGGPTYGDVQKQVERPLPFYRLEVETHNRFGDPVSMRPQIKGDRLHVSAPNLENPWNRGLRPKKISGRVDDLQVVRTNDLRPEIKERFRNVREQEIQRSTQTIRDMGGEDPLRSHRQQQLSRNQIAIQEQSRRSTALATTPPLTSKPRTETSASRPIDDRAAMPAESRDEKEPRNGLADSRPAGSSRPERTRPRTDDSPPRTTSGTQARVTPSVPKDQVVRPGPLIVDPHYKNFGGSRKQTENNSHHPQQQLEQSQREQERKARQLETQRQQEHARQQQLEASRREQARQQQRETQRQQEQARQQQLEASRREQARQQQLETERRQEQARQRQLDESRREQARQQQLETERRQEQARQRQLDESRREQARRQPVEDTHRDGMRQRQASQQPGREDSRGRNR